MKKTLLFSLAFIGQIGISTAAPLVIFGLLGRYLDEKYGTGPYLLLTSLAFATVIVYFTLRQVVKKAIEEFNKVNNQPKSE